MRHACSLLIALALAACGRTTPPAPAPAPEAAPEVRTAAPEPVAAPTPELALDASAYPKLGPPRPGDWRAAHPDDVANDFDEYVASDPVRADDERRVLAFLPVGEFDATQRGAVDAAAEFAGLWFDLPVRVLPAAALTDEPEQFRVRPAAAGPAGARQYRTSWFLNALLPDRVPDDAVVLLGVTMADLYPNARWNYVFGEAHLRRRVGVWSLARYFPEFWDEPRDEASLRLALLRTLKVVVHETGHTFGLEHCTLHACAMNGSNSLDETDRAPLHLCPECLRKLAWNRGFDVAARFERLAAFLDARGLADEAAWHRARAAEVRAR